MARLPSVWAPRLWHPPRKAPLQITHFFGRFVDKREVEELVYIGQYVHDTIWFCTSLHPDKKMTFADITKRSARPIIRLPMSVLSYNPNDTLWQDGKGAVWIKFTTSPRQPDKLVKLINSSKEWGSLIEFPR